MYRVSDAKGRLEMKEVVVGELDRNKLDSGDVFIVDSGNGVFVWIGKGKKNATNELYIIYPYVSSVTSFIHMSFGT